MRKRRSTLMEITREAILHLEDMSMLKLSEGEREDAQRDFGDILTYMETLGEVDTQDVEPLIHVFPVSNVMREDEVIQSPEPAVIFRNAPNRKGNCFKVPKTVE
jgi:aspartyl-tRNA(Asn)/glutamyl-tRNA(Gln) amidotransferase subunit C